jgi:dimethylaniline monooxygenase (N-oxide forming)
VRKFSYRHRTQQLMLHYQLDVLELPINSPLRNTHSMFWSVQSTDEGGYRPNGFHAAVNRGDIQLFPSARVKGFGADGRSVILSTGQSLPVDVVISSTGFTSSWSHLFDGAFLFIMSSGT